jgi:hypothetical protein
MIRMEAYIPYGIFGKNLKIQTEVNSRARPFQIRDVGATKVAWGRSPMWRNYVRTLFGEQNHNLNNY